VGGGLEGGEGEEGMGKVDGGVLRLIAIKVVGNEKDGGSGKYQTFAICLGPRRSMFFSLIVLSSVILYISVSAPVKQNE
jgi:hypothetical protein